MEAVPDLTDWRHRGCIEMLRSISQRDFDLVHIHNIHSGAFSIRAVQGLAARFPCVWTLHDEWAPSRGLTYNLTGRMSPVETKRISRGLIRYIPYDRYHENPKWRRTRRFLSRWLPQPKTVICPSRYMASLAKASGVFPVAGIVHIPNGTRMVDLPEAGMEREEAKASLGLERDQQTVLIASVDLAQAHKGTDLAISAIRSLARRNPVQVLLLGGSATLVAESLRPVPTMCLSASDDALLARAYRAADVSVVPSLADNFPYVGLESLACGAPVVAFPVGGLPEIVGRNERGIICQGVDPQEMSLHIATLLSDSSRRRRLGEQGVAWVRNTCGMSGYLKSIVNTYEQVLDGCQQQNPLPGEPLCV
jgi:glycosyltransferase involved in cell wall biosynthesis